MKFKKVRKLLMGRNDTFAKRPNQIYYLGNIGNDILCWDTGNSSRIDICNCGFDLEDFEADDWEMYCNISGRMAKMEIFGKKEVEEMRREIVEEPMLQLIIDNLVENTIKLMEVQQIQESKKDANKNN